MSIPERLRSWILAIKGIEGPAGNELRRLVDRIRMLQTDKTARSTGGKRETP